MAEQLPTLTKSQAVNSTEKPASSLLGRGLAAIQRKETGVVLSDMDKRYRQARSIYNKIKNYNNWNFIQTDLFENDLRQTLLSIFTTFQQLANQGYGKAYFVLAKMYQDNEGIKENLEKSYYYRNLAFNWYFANRMLDDSEIWRDLGWMYYNGFGTEEDHEQAVFWVSKAAEQGDAVEQYNLGAYYSGRDDEQAAFWYEQAAEQGYALAQFELGLMYFNGQGVEQNDKQAAFWYEQAAEQDYAPAQFELGWMYENGCGVEQNDELAVFWYEQAAEQGNEEAQEKLTEFGINWQEL